MSPFWHGVAWGATCMAAFLIAVVVLADWSRKRGGR